MFSTTKTSASGLEKYVTGAARNLSPVHYKTAHGYTGGEILYRKSDSTYALALASASDTAEVLGVVNRSEGTDRFSLTTEGEVTLTVANFQEATLTGLVDGMVLFLSGTTAGKFTWTEPNTTSYISKPLVKVTSISGGIVKGVFNNMRGTTVGGTNLYTTIPLNNGTATTILNLSDDTMFPVGSCGELTGGECNILQTGAFTDYIFGFKVLWAKTASNVVNIQPDAMADVPPGFAFGTSGANIQVSFTALANFESGKVRYAMNAAPIGAQLPLQIDGSRVNGPVLGSTSGVAIGAEKVGEKINFTTRTVTGSGGAWTSNTSALATLTAGVWRVASRASFSGSGSANAVECKVCTNSATNDTGTITDLFMVYAANASAANSFNLPMAEWDIVNVSTTQDLFAKCFGEDAAVNVTVAGFAVRIA